MRVVPVRRWPSAEGFDFLNASGPFERIVSSSLIGDLVSDQLRDLDQVAYIRFVSVYKAFSEPEEFLRELDAVLDAELDDYEAPHTADRTENS